MGLVGLEPSSLLALGDTVYWSLLASFLSTTGDLVRGLDAGLIPPETTQIRVNLPHL